MCPSMGKKGGALSFGDIYGVYFGIFGSERGRGQNSNFQEPSVTCLLVLIQLGTKAIHRISILKPEINLQEEIDLNFKGLLLGAFGLFRD
jgi:hypothetical protein